MPPTTIARAALPNHSGRQAGFELGPSSFDVLMKTIETALTRPRHGVGRRHLDEGVADGDAEQCRRRPK
jgi:hypothetical protein